MYGTRSRCARRTSSDEPGTALKVKGITARLTERTRPPSRTMRPMLSARRTAAALLVAAQAICLAVSLYQSAITVAGRVAAGRRRRFAAPDPLPRFLMLVCARNEEAVIGRVVADLLAQDYPADAFDVLVVAHNCDDATATVARAAGARVHVAAGEPGKAAALRAGVAAVEPGWDFIGVFDADSRVPPNLLAEVARRSPGEDCLQVETIPMPVDDWLVEGYGLGRRARNALWWRPREALGLGTTTSGSGYFVRQTIPGSPLASAQTITEDLELTVRIARSGRRVAYVSSAYVMVEESHRLGASLRQRTRWARGHLRVLAFGWPGLALRGLRGDWRAFDMAVYLAVPTRLLTRTGVSLSLILAIFRAPWALPLLPVSVGFMGEWLLPAYVAFRDRLVPPSMAGLLLALRHSLLSFLWFPIGVWALITAGATTWHPVPRTLVGKSGTVTTNPDTIAMSRPVDAGRLRKDPGRVRPTDLRAMGR
jgi:cellulose synthase/poly-beta-1,6-N-acetylglucosamine synthase-like glycosyltransferase